MQAMATEVEKPLTPPEESIVKSAIILYLETLDNFGDLSFNDKAFIETIIQFATELNLDSWDSSHHISKALKVLPIVVEKLNPTLLTIFINWYYQDNSVQLKGCIQHIFNPTLESRLAQVCDINDPPNRTLYGLLICFVYFVRYHIDDNHKISNILELLRKLLDLKCLNINPYISAKTIFYIGLYYDKMSRLSSITRFLFHMLCINDNLGHDEPRAVIINLILNSYIRSDLWTQADRFVKKTKFPESASNSQQARYAYSTGMICLITQNYHDALFKFQESFTISQSLECVGFRQTIVRMILLTKLLLGEFPDRKLFVDECYYSDLLPYLEIVRAVKAGRHTLFTECFIKHRDQFIRDKTAKIVHRLHHNVIKTALYKLSLSYSAISFDDIATKLQLPLNDVEFMVAKAIKDGDIIAVINHDDRVVNFKTNEQVYFSDDALKQLKSRINESQNLYSNFLQENLEDMSDMEYIMRTYEEDYL